jgi:hypothetical protein
VTSTAALLLVGTAALALEVIVRRRLGPRTPIGDELEYLDRARRADPYSPSPFLRVPLFIAFARLARGDGTLTSLLLFGVALAGIGLTAWAGHLAAGPLGMLAVGLLYTLLPDRWILSRHLWPDTLLALWQAAILVLVVAATQGETVSPWLFGGLAGLAVATRVDALALLAPLLLVSRFHGHSGGGMALVALAAPSLVVLTVLTVWNRSRHRIAWPDTTVLFNLRVGAEERRSPGAGVEQVVGAAWSKWIRREEDEGSVRSRATILLDAPRRLLAMLGADSFARDRLLGSRPGAYPELPRFPRALLRGALRVSFPLLLALAVGGVVARPELCREPLVLGATILVASSLVHARTRFRYSLLPHLAFCAGIGLVSASASGQWERFLLVVTLAGGLFLLLPERIEEGGAI